jgi:hypothetical protein
LDRHEESIVQHLLQQRQRTGQWDARQYSRLSESAQREFIRRMMQNGIVPKL